MPKVAGGLGIVVAVCYPRAEPFSLVFVYLVEDAAHSLASCGLIAGGASSSVQPAKLGQRRRATEEKSLSDLTFIGDASFTIVGSAQLVEASRKKRCREPGRCRS